MEAPVAERLARQLVELAGERQLREQVEVGAEVHAEELRTAQARRAYHSEGLVDELDAGNSTVDIEAHKVV